MVGGGGGFVPGCEISFSMFFACEIFFVEYCFLLLTSHLHFLPCKKKGRNQEIGKGYEVRDTKHIRSGGPRQCCVGSDLWPNQTIFST